MSYIKTFHAFGEANKNDFSPHDCEIILGSTNKLLLRDLRSLEGMYLIKRFPKYPGECSFKHFKVVTRILYVIRSEIVSQCESFKTGVMCSNFHFLQHNSVISVTFLMNVLVNYSIPCYSNPVC